MVQLYKIYLISARKWGTFMEQVSAVSYFGGIEVSSSIYSIAQGNHVLTDSMRAYCMQAAAKGQGERYEDCIH